MLKKKTVFLVTCTQSLGKHITKQLYRNVRTSDLKNKLKFVYVELAKNQDMIHALKGDIVLVDYFLNRDVPKIASNLSPDVCIELLNIGSTSTHSPIMLERQLEPLLQLNPLEIRVHNNQDFSLLEYVLPAADIGQNRL
ncbi:hypothetical protein [Enterococcus thailandicus]|uniref:Uncharacterized protein n=1 Tax=Enterococcus thailandicus TaxID=417368 RepID=A0A179ETC2_ENTTH|nr:hypothetical protein [Enterococcus thailandicus]MDT2750737.1 hypothetical protein [Enterococcus thailandicus]MDT2775296.1 hypothetical protein [Enterococcus thailandicus]OAQ56412.1 hypothetical protein A6E74_03100 [Enterococcus thailandicus]